MKRIVLVRTQGPRNVGSVLRVALNFGPAELLLVQPEKPSVLIHPDFVQMAHGVADIAQRVRVCTSLEEALEDCTWSYGFTARSRDLRTVQDWRAVSPALVERAADESSRTALVFGCEENGLTTEETSLVHELVKMPTGAEHTSINLAMTVGIVLSTIFFADAPSTRSEGNNLTTGKDRRFLTERLKEVLGSCATSEPARRDLVASIERVFSLTPLETQDARAWHLLARALERNRRNRNQGAPTERQSQPTSEA